MSGESLQHPDDGKWMAWIEGQISADESMRLSIHCENCPRCTDTVAGLRRALESSVGRKPLPAEFLQEAKAEFLASLPASLRSVQASTFSLRIPAAQAGMYKQLPLAVWMASAFYFLVTVVAWALWMSSGDWSFASAAFGLPLKIFLGFAASSAVALDYFCLRQFGPRHSLHAAWSLLLTGSACRLLGSAANTVPAFFPDGRWATLEAAGQFIAGPVALLALGLGLVHVRRAYESSGFAAPLRIADWVILGVASLFTVRHIAEVAGILVSGPAKPLLVMLNWFSEPALLFVLSVAVPLRRNAIAHNSNLVARCWTAMTTGVLLIFAADLLLFFSNYGYLVWPYNSVIWLLWIPAFSAFTLAPAYQLAANGELAAQPSLATNPR